VGLFAKDSIAKYKNIQYQNKPEDKIKLARSA
jgi:hypothetical protein